MTVETVRYPLISVSTLENFSRKYEVLLHKTLLLIFSSLSGALPLLLLSRKVQTYIHIHTETSLRQTRSLPSPFLFSQGREREKEGKKTSLRPSLIGYRREEEKEDRENTLSSLSFSKTLDIFFSLALRLLPSSIVLLTFNREKVRLACIR